MAMWVRDGREDTTPRDCVYEKKKNWIKISFPSNSRDVYTYSRVIKMKIMKFKGKRRKIHKSGLKAKRIQRVGVVSCLKIYETDWKKGEDCVW